MIIHHFASIWANTKNYIHQIYIKFFPVFSKIPIILTINENITRGYLQPYISSHFIFRTIYSRFDTLFYIFSLLFNVNFYPSFENIIQLMKFGETWQTKLGKQMLELFPLFFPRYPKNSWTHLCSQLQRPRHGNRYEILLRASLTTHFTSNRYRWADYKLAN